MLELPDVQKYTQGFPNIFIEKVGVENIKVNMNIKSKYKNKQLVIANIDSYCSLDENTKGINMSRIGRGINKVLKDNKDKDGFDNLKKFVLELKDVHEADNVYIKANFDYMIDKQTPVTDLYSPEPVNVTFENLYEDNKHRSMITVKAVETSLCPCSKQMSLLKNNIKDKELNLIRQLPKELCDKILMSGFGAHNQKSEIKVKVELKENQSLWIEDIADIIKASVSAPTYTILKRPDEKWVTEVAYLGGYFDDGEFKYVGGGPRFVEDISRDVVLKLNEYLDKKIVDYIVKVNNYESIHSDNISAASFLTAGRRFKPDSIQ
ncbi:GTP cyclohydrolase FolE2 [Clostridium subterminale]|uniref:GTP cyclohydrolase FolE2 n=1 Tax=Clostridium subterminale TaxID=1550 RepID=A0ABN1KP82_CLOSU